MTKKENIVLNRTTNEFSSNLGQIRVVESNDFIVIEHHVSVRERLYSEYSNFAVKTAQATVEMCRVVYEAKSQLSKSEFLVFLNDIGHKSESSKIRKYLAIGEKYEKLIQHTNLLPNSWTSIYTITQLPLDTFDALAATDTDMSNMSGKQIESLVKLSKPKSSSSTCVVPNNSAELSSNEKHDESLMLSDVEQANSDTLNSDMLIGNKAIDVDTTDDTYEVLVRFKSKPTDDSWWDLTEAIEAVVDEKNLNVQIIETRPLFKVVA